MMKCSYGNFMADCFVFYMLQTSNLSEFSFELKNTGDVNHTPACDALPPALTLL